MITDTERLDFLESLMGRHVSSNRKGQSYFQTTDIHIRGPEYCTIYARTGIGSDVEYEAVAKTVRNAIDTAIISNRMMVKNENPESR